MNAAKRHGNGWLRVMLVLVWALVLSRAGEKAARALTATPPGVAVAILTPAPHQALQGQVRIVGTTDIPRFRRATLLFGYAHDPTGTWFLLTTHTTPTHRGFLALWDTTRITDGDYVLRLVVENRAGQQFEATVPVRVRNYTPIETPTPTPPRAGHTPSPASAPRRATPTPPTPHPTPTPVPTSPAVLTTAALTRAAGWGVGSVLAFLALFALLRKIW